MGREAFEGSEFDWFAVDGVGHVGLFSTAGYGAVPISVLARVDELRGLAGRLLEAPVVGTATGHLPGRIDDWLAVAQRGVFAYDWHHWFGPYRRVATPSRPVRVGELPAHLREPVGLVEWSGIRFEVMESLRPEELCPCG